MRVFSDSKDHHYFTEYIDIMTDKLFKILIITGIILFTPLMTAFSFDRTSISIHIAVSELEKAEAPQFIDNHILFTYFKRDDYIRRVAIAFDLDGYKQIFPFMKNENNVFFLVKAIPEKTRILNYRLIVDGVWISDPENSYSVYTPENIKISQLKIPENYMDTASTPIIEDNGNVKFVFRDKTNKNVYLSGNFNNWDPFMLKLKEDERDPGTYEISLRMSPGKHFYTFISDGVTVRDPNNPHKVTDSRGNPISYIEIN
ncbi:MAG: glycogen-binding domain-containing protein [Spirochaetales bacterium]|nr:glycogen-binding domain-containing protein [Spirochaetales bacterium]